MRAPIRWVIARAASNSRGIPFKLFSAYHCMKSAPLIQIRLQHISPLRARSTACKATASVSGAARTASAPLTGESDRTASRVQLVRAGGRRYHDDSRRVVRRRIARGRCAQAGWRPARIEREGGPRFRSGPLAISLSRQWARASAHCSARRWGCLRVTKVFFRHLASGLFIVQYLRRLRGEPNNARPPVPIAARTPNVSQGDPHGRLGVTGLHACRGRR